MSDLLAAIKQASDRGWRVVLTIDGTDDFTADAFRGDSNCPHNKPYSKSDGHGFETVEDAILGSLDEVVAWMMTLEDFKR